MRSRYVNGQRNYYTTPKTSATIPTSPSFKSTSQPKQTTYTMSATKIPPPTTSTFKSSSSARPLTRTSYAVGGARTGCKSCGGARRF